MLDAIREFGTGKILIALISLFLVFGTFAAFDLRNRMSSSRLGSDVVYTLDAQGNAAVEMKNKSYFVDTATAENFDAMAARLGRPDAEVFRKSVEESTNSLAGKAGRPMMVSDFEAGFQRAPEYGAQVYKFKWTGFAEKRDGIWAVDFKAAGAVKLTADSSLAIVLPPGATLIKAEPAPKAGDGARTLVWTGAGEIPWPYIEYK
jgi:hypothetical protein